MRHIHTSIVSRHLATRGNNKILCTPPPHTSSSEEILPRLTRRTLAQLRTNKSPFLKSYLHKVDAKAHQSPLCPLCNIHTHDHTSSLQLHPHTHHIVAPGFVDRPRRSDCTAGQMDGEAGWWTTSGNIGLPPLARVMGVGRQQQQAQRSKWKEMIESTDFTQSSRKAWKTDNKLTKDYTEPQQQCKVTADQESHQLLLNGKGNKLHVPRREKMPRQTVTESKLTSPFLMEDRLRGVKALKNNKAAGLDDMLCEQIKHFGEATLRWLLQMMNSILKTQKFPKLWMKSKVIAILKPGKDSTLPKSYRPISLLCHTYKLFERMILNRLNPLIETMIIDQQAGFRPESLQQDNYST